MNPDHLLAGPPATFRLKDRSTSHTWGVSESHARKALHQDQSRLAELHNLLYAENKRALLIVLQGMDASGKDGTIRHVMAGVNPQGCLVTAFKQPGPEDLQHDFLWRIHAAVPARGSIGIFNRSHYEDVLVPRVHRLLPRKEWQRRYAQINAFEKILTGNGIHILKFFLHMSAEEQAKRFRERLEDPRKNWKASAADFKEREYWKEYERAYQAALTECNTSYAPWFVIPADRKWFRNYAVAQVTIRALESFAMKYPRPAPAAVKAARASLSDRE